MPLWTCQTCGDQRRGPQKPRLNATIRFCLSCSSNSPVLVPRICEALEKKRAEKHDQRVAAQKRKRASARRALEKRQLQASERAEARFWWCGQDLRVLWSKTLRLPSVPKELRKIKPVLTVRHCTQQPRSVVGRAWGCTQKIQVSVWPNCSLESVLDTMLHELAHLCCWAKFGWQVRSHGSQFHGTLHDLQKDWEAVSVETE